MNTLEAAAIDWTNALAVAAQLVVRALGRVCILRSHHASTPVVRRRRRPVAVVVAATATLSVVALLTARRIRSRMRRTAVDDDGSFNNAARTLAADGSECFHSSHAQQVIYMDNIYFKWLQKSKYNSRNTCLYIILTQKGYIKHLLFILIFKQICTRIMK